MAYPAVVELRFEFALVVGVTLLSARILMVVVLTAICIVQREMRMDMTHDDMKKAPLVVIPDSPSPTKNLSTPRSSPFLTHDTPIANLGVQGEGG